MRRVLINGRQSKGEINRNLYGHFAEHLGRCIYGGFYVDPGQTEIPQQNGLRTDVVKALRQLDIPLLRWPGGSFADTYHWRDGVGPRQERRPIINTVWGGTQESNHFGTQEFLELCQLLDCEPYITGNTASGSIQELQQWVDFCNQPAGLPGAELRELSGHPEPWQVRYWGIGNEPWGGGKASDARFYALQYRQFARFLRADPQHPLCRVACGASVDDYTWTRVMMEELGTEMELLSLHYYTRPYKDWSQRGPATGFSRQEYYNTLENACFMEDLIENHSRIMRQYDPSGKVQLAIDEWGTWFLPDPGSNPAFLYQQNTMRDALVAAIHLNLFNNHCDTVAMANLAQTVNVLQALLLTKGPRLLLTPTYYVFLMYKEHQGARQLETFAETKLLREGAAELPDLSVSASQAADGSLLLTLANLDDQRPQELRLYLDGLGAAWPLKVSAQLLSGQTAGAWAFNSFDQPCQVQPQLLPVISKGPGELAVTLPEASIAAVKVL
ncbi:MAG: alpha-L-arabinofuranosidase C-terminal domain-containing protein [Oscillospiraceae bacterium]|nr:alpha-L-arabinofuranosidase C-terminal domain-containing protein [Oscillospiraceae bacterium]MDD4369357.1 alpha-L-arabinofuranosidase C-terminal domain-containing protein [Oscillospiraceae bacterium]